MVGRRQRSSSSLSSEIIMVPRSLQAPVARLVCFPFLVARSAIPAVTVISGCTFDDLGRNRDPHCNEFHFTYRLNCPELGI